VSRFGIVRHDPKTKAMTLIAADASPHWPDTRALHPSGDLVSTASAPNQHFEGRG
jgi:hypothetical protein